MRAFSQNKEKIFLAFLNKLSDSNIHLEFERISRSHPGKTWKIENRQIDYFLLYFVIKNTLKAGSGTEVQLLPAGSVCLTSPQALHSFCCADGCLSLEIFNIRFKLHDPDVPELKNFIFTHNAWHLHHYFIDMYDEFAQDRHFRINRIRSFLTIILSELFRNIVRNENRRMLSHKQRLLVDEFYEKKFPGPYDVKELAQLSGLSHDYYTRAFKNTYGYSPRVWFPRRLVLDSRTHLEETDLSITAIAGIYGFEDIYHYSRQFKKVCMVSPVAFRKKSL